MLFHTFHSANVLLDPTRKIATWSQSLVSDGYVFGAEAVREEERFAFKVDAEAFPLTVTLGFTSADMATLDPLILLKKPHELADDDNYWAVLVDAVQVNSPDNIVSFWMEPTGKVVVRSGGLTSTLLYVDSTIPIRWFFHTCADSIEIQLVDEDHKENELTSGMMSMSLNNTIHQESQQSDLVEQTIHEFLAEMRAPQPSGQEGVCELLEDPSSCLMFQDVCGENPLEWRWFGTRVENSVEHHDFILATPDDGETVFDLPEGIDKYKIIQSWTKADLVIYTIALI